MKEHGMNSLHYVLVGHFAKDILPDGGYMLGGTAFYSGVQAHRLGNRVSIISSTGDDLVLDSLPNGITCYIQPAPQSTTFENIYDAQGNHRTFVIFASGKSIHVTLISSPTHIHLSEG